MKTSNAFAAVAAMIGLTHAFLFTDCNSGELTNFGDNDCQIWTADRFSFQSDSGCELTVYSAGNCEGDDFITSVQETCMSAPFTPTSAICRL